jgi:hypothetical protein
MFIVFILYFAIVVLNVFPPFTVFPAFNRIFLLLSKMEKWNFDIHLYYIG